MCQKPATTPAKAQVCASPLVTSTTPKSGPARSTPVSGLGPGSCASPLVSSRAGSGHGTVELAGGGGVVIGEGDEQGGGCGADLAGGQLQAGPGADAAAAGVGEAGDQGEGGVVGD